LLYSRLDADTGKPEWRFPTTALEGEGPGRRIYWKKRIAQPAAGGGAEPGLGGHGYEFPEPQHDLLGPVAQTKAVGFRAQSGKEGGDRGGSQPRPQGAKVGLPPALNVLPFRNTWAQILGETMDNKLKKGYISSTRRRVLKSLDWTRCSERGC